MWARKVRVGLPVPRLLPLTILVMAALTLVKAAALARLAFAGPGPLLPPVGDPPALVLAQAMAQSTPAAEPPPATRPAPTAPPAAASKDMPAAPPAGGAAAPVSESERELLQELRGRRGELDARQSALDARQAVLDATERRLAARVSELAGLQSKLEGLEAARKKREEANWAGLVKAYEVMKPRDAAAIFNDLEMPILLQILDRMKDTKVAPVLAAMQTDRAREATTKLAEMRLRQSTIGNTAGAPPAPGG
jgi:flagellar motility protein MotE (MotC chaperone)